MRVVPLSTPIPPKTNKCASICTLNPSTGNREVLYLSLDKPVTIGRNKDLCTYVIPHKVVSNIHCKLAAVLSANNTVIVSCQDLSTNGLVVNGHHVQKSSVILMDGDVLQLKQLDQQFICSVVMGQRDKDNAFDPTPPSKPLYKRLGKYTIMGHGCLGKGSFAAVHLAFDSEKIRQVACKVVRARKDAGVKKAMKEARVLLGLKHPNINRIWDVEVEGKWLYIFLQLCTGGDLFTYISWRDNNAGLVEGEAKYIMYQILQGLKYLHDRKIAHRDIKPENVLLFAPGPYPRVQIADFGLARSKAYQETFNVCGTVSYLPPEGILALTNKDLGYVGIAADCWSSGVILYIMLSGNHPFDSQSPSLECSAMGSIGTSKPDTIFQSPPPLADDIIKARIVQGRVDFSDTMWDRLPDAQGLIEGLMVIDSSKRLDIHGALQSRWMAVDQVVLEAAYQDRIGIV